MWVHQLNELVIAVGPLLGAWVVVDFRNDRIVPSGLSTRAAIVGEQNEQIVVVDDGIAVEVGLALSEGKTR